MNIKKVALSGNRTPVSRVAGENSTTEPTMPGMSGGSILSTSKVIFPKKKSALSGNRTPVSRVAGENSTTEPTMLAIFDISFEGQDVQMTFLCKCDALQNWPRWGSNPQSSDSKSDALSIGPRGRCMFVKIWCNYLWQHETLLRQWHWITITRKGGAICTFIWIKC